ncbi:MAG TPA: hypothetical protein VL463_17605, partial [Kofleriaceae bacterium]|nr:hypothetical protein [Kofleriaceae bacterium]
ADVELEFDVFGDGTVDYTQSIPTAHWEPVSYLVSIAPPYNGIKFRLSKHGAGHAVLAEITAKTHKKEDCTGAPVALPPRPDGAWCVAQGDCASGVCDGIALPLNPSPVCSACVDDNGCSPGSVCGIDDAVPSWLVPYRACIPAASRALGELCKEDAECASGVCNQTCSTCNDMGHACAGGEACKPASQEFPAPNGYKYYSVPTFECAPGTHARATGETCLRSDDCASNSCVGTGETKTCIDVFGAGDGRACASDLDCPEGNTLTHGPCVAIGITGGTCQ